MPAPTSSRRLLSATSTRNNLMPCRSHECKNENGRQSHLRAVRVPGVAFRPLKQLGPKLRMGSIRDFRGRIPRGGASSLMCRSRCFERNKRGGAAGHRLQAYSAAWLWEGLPRSEIKSQDGSPITHAITCPIVAYQSAEQRSRRPWNRLTRGYMAV